MATTITVTGIIKNISRIVRGCTVKVTSNPATGPIGETPDIIWPGSAVCQTDADGVFNFKLGKGDYLLTIDDASTPSLAFSVVDTTPVLPVNVLLLLTNSIVFTKGSLPGQYYQATKTLTAGQDTVVFSGLSIPFTPVSVAIFEMAPDGSLALTFTPIASTLSTGGVTANISGIPAGTETAVAIFYPAQS